MLWDPMRGISILANFRPKYGVQDHAVIDFGLGSNILFKSVLGYCV